MEYRRISASGMEPLWELQKAYKAEIREVQFAWRESGVSSMTVGCADCDADMYQALGFSVPLGNLLAFE